MHVLFEKESFLQIQWGPFCRFQCSFQCAFFWCNGFKYSKDILFGVTASLPSENSHGTPKIGGLNMCFLFQGAYGPFIGSTLVFGCVYIHKTYSKARNVTPLPFGRNLVGQRTTLWCHWKIQYAVYICLVELETNQQMKNWKMMFGPFLPFPPMKHLSAVGCY